MNCVDTYHSANQLLFMKLIPIVLTSLFVLGLSLFDPPTATAQRDRIYDTEGKQVSGTITSVTTQGVEIERSGNTQAFKAGEIEKIMYEGDPSGLTRGREFALDGQYDQALEELRKIDFGEIDRQVITADAAYYLALCEAKLALAGKGNKEAAAKKLLSFAGKYRTSWHFYEAAKLLGDLALGLNDHAKALRYYGSLIKAPSADTKIESVYLTGVVQLKQGDAASAIEQFDKVIGVKAQTIRSNRLQALATAGKAASLAMDSKADDGLQLLDSLINDLDATDIDLAARIYNAQGLAYESKGDNEGAILAYLHTHLMFSSVPDAHAEALKRLVELWPKVGKPEEAAKARQELQQRYPGF
jgi:TolA-binding protein